MIIMATMATVIASQAVISGVFSLARQAIQLGYLPRLSIKHTSESEEGQIYVPFLNWLLLIAIIILILIFKTSSNLASAYGLAVTLTMLCDTILVSIFIYSAWKWSWPKVVLLIIPFFILESVLVAATSLKVLSVVCAVAHWWYCGHYLMTGNVVVSLPLLNSNMTRFL